MENNFAAQVLEDDLAISVAQALTAANKKAEELGVVVPQSLISIIQHNLNGSSVWRISYIPKNYINQRGGDVIIEVDMNDATIKKVLQGQ